LAIAKTPVYDSQMVQAALPVADDVDHHIIVPARLAD